MASTQKFESGLPDLDFVFKMIMAGDSSVGKSSLLLRYSENSFLAKKILNTIVADSATKTIQIDGKMIKLQISDTIGQERFTKLSSLYYRGAHGVIIAFDLTNIKSFQSIRSWLSEIDEYSGPNVSKILVGNKSDLKDKRVVSYENAKEFADQLDIPYLETSAKTARNVEESFMTLAAEIKKNFDSGVFKNNVKPIKLNEGRYLDGKPWSLGNICSC